MPTDTVKAFISYTSELRDECRTAAEVCQDLKVDFFNYQDVSANGTSPEQVLKDQLEESQIYLGIIGGRHGSLHPPPEDRSVVEFEFDTFHSHEGPRLTAVFHKVLPSESIEPLQEKFRSKHRGLMSKVWKRDFDSIDRLRSEVRDAILTHLVKINHPRKKAEETQVEKTLRAIMFIGGIFGALVLITAIASLVLVLPKEIALTVISCLATAILMSVGFVKFVL